MKYADYAPTAFDGRGAFLPDRQDWIVLPVIQTRDSGPMEFSNFAAALEILGGEGETVEVHRFGHWGPGWFEIILVDPADSARVAVAEDIENRLADYPLLDEEDFSRREWEDYEAGWESYGWSEFIRLLAKRFNLPERAVDLLRDADSEALRQFFQDGIPSGEYYIGESSGVSVNLRSWRGEKSDVARLLVSLRRGISSR